MKTCSLDTMHFKDYLFVSLKGILLGLVSVGIPGLSASTIGIIVGIYFLMVEAISGIFKNPKKSIPFLLFLILGYGVGAVSAAFSVSLLFENFPLITTIIICGIILGCIPDQFIKLKDAIRKPSCWIVFGIVFVLILLYNLFLNTGENTVIFPTDPNILYLIEMFSIGLITSATFIIPGVDFAAVFLSLGMYYPFMTMIADIFRFGSENYLSYIVGYAEILLFYLLGYMIGVFLFSKFIRFLLKKFEMQVQFAATAFICASPFIVMKNCIFDNASFTYDQTQMILGIVIALFIMAIMFFINDKSSKVINEKKEQSLTESSPDVNKMNDIETINQTEDQHE